MRKQTAVHLANDVPIRRVGVKAAFLCNYQGDIAPAQVIRTLEDGLAIAAETDALIEVGRMAERIVGHVLRSELVHAGSLDAFRRQVA